MSVVLGILAEEELRLAALAKKYKNKLSSVPNASVRNKNNYLYYTYRKGKKVFSKYIGVVSSKKAQNALELDKERKKYKSMLKEIDKELKDIRRLLGNRASSTFS